MKNTDEYNRACQPSFDPLFCLLAEALELQCKGRPCDTCRLRPNCLRMWDRLCGDSVKRPLAPSDYDTAERRIRFMQLFK
jgi:hypothetical protein